MATQPGWFHKNLIPAPNWIPLQILQTSKEISLNNIRKDICFWMQVGKSILYENCDFTCLHSGLPWECNNSALAWQCFLNAAPRPAHMTTGCILQVYADGLAVLHLRRHKHIMDEVWSRQTWPGSSHVWSVIGLLTRYNRLKTGWTHWVSFMKH